LEDLKKMSLLDIMHKWGGTEAVIKSYDNQAGTCLCCSHLFDSLESVCMRYKIPVDELIKKLEVHTSQD
jgi:hypothetical protein